MAEQQLYSDIVNEAGGLLEMIRKTQERRALVRKMDAEYSDLLARYPDRWVAVSKDGVAATSDTLEGLFAELKGKRISIEDVYHDYISAETVHYLL